MKKTLYYKDNKSDKFWKIEVNENTHTVTYGKIGSNGMSKTKEFDNDETALKDAEKLIASKIKKGYQEKKEDSSEEVIHYEDDNSAEIIVDMDNVGSVRLALEAMTHLMDKYFDDGGSSFEYDFVYGQLNEKNQFKKYEKSAHFFYKVIEAYPQLYPEVAKFVESVNAHLYTQPHIGLEPAGLLAEKDIKYLDLFASIFSYVDLDHAIGEQEYLEAVLGAHPTSKEIIDFATSFGSYVFDVFAIDGNKELEMMDYFIKKLIDEELGILEGKTPKDFDENFDLTDSLVNTEEDLPMGIYHDFASFLNIKEVDNEDIYHRMNLAIAQNIYPTYKYLSTGKF